MTDTNALAARMPYEYPNDDTEWCPCCERGERDEAHPDDPYYDSPMYDALYGEDLYPTALAAWCAKARFGMIQLPKDFDYLKAYDFLAGYDLMYNVGNQRERASLIVMIERYLAHLPEPPDTHERGDDEEAAWLEVYQIDTHGTYHGEKLHGQQKQRKKKKLLAYAMELTNKRRSESSLHNTYGHSIPGGEPK